MVWRFFAIALFSIYTAIGLPAQAGDLAAHFVVTSPPIAVPAFAFEDAGGRILDIKDFRGHYVLLNLWATWCGPCVREMPGLDALARKLDVGAGSSRPKTGAVAIVSGNRASDATSSHPPIDIVALTEDHDGRGAAEAFYKRHNLRHLPVFVDVAGQAPFILHVHGLPTTLLIDPNGKETGRIEGDADWDDPDTVAFLEEQMKRNAAHNR